MKTTAFQKKDYKFTADLYKFTISTDAEGGAVRTYVFDRSITLFVTNAYFGKLKVGFLDSEEDIVVGCRLENLNDGGGKEILPNGIWEIDQFLPSINPYHRREGFEGTVTVVAVDA